MISISQARQELADLVNRVAYRHERIPLGRRGKPVAALVSAGDLALLEALEDAADLRAIAEALADPQNAAAPLAWAELEAELDRRRG
jgi:prevent-host-death family protein